MKIDKFPTTVLDFADAINEHEDRIARLEKLAGIEEKFVCPCCGREMQLYNGVTVTYWYCKCGVKTEGKDTKAEALSDVRALQK